jgi:dTDP-4-amino-4,6-dideoxygalactose transaminase
MGRSTRLGQNLYLIGKYGTFTHLMNVPLIDLKAQYQSIRSEIRQSIDHVLDSQKFILDSEVASLEKETAEFCNSRFAIACASGTDALLLSLLALDVKEGDEVITTSYSFFSTAGMISWIKAKPVFVDIDPETFNLHTDQVAQKINPKTKAIIAVHLFGQCSRMEDLNRLGIPVIEDAAQGIGATRNERPAGSMGITGCFSYFPTKNLGGYGDGGMITTQEEEIAKRIRILRKHGQDMEQYLHPVVGTNSRLDELQAAVLRAKMKHLSEWNLKRRKNAAFYSENLKDLPLQLPQTDKGNAHTFHQYVIKTEARDALKKALTEKGIGSAVYYPIPLPFQPCFADLRYKPGDFPNAEKCAATCLALPIYPELTSKQLEFVVSGIRTFFQ